jgi:hypothetical protein
MMLQMEDVNWQLFVNCQVNILAYPFMHELSVATLFQSSFSSNVYVEVDYCYFSDTLMVVLWKQGNSCGCGWYIH